MITYIATNTVNGKFYIGSTVNFKKRKREHLNTTGYPFQNALRANPESFEWEIFEDDSEERILEQALLDMFGNTEQCYNLMTEASHGPVMRGKDNPSFGLGDNHWNKGLKRSSETVQKLSHSLIGNNRTKGKKWWVNKAGERKMSEQSPGPEWKNGMKW